MLVSNVFPLTNRNKRVVNQNLTCSFASVGMELHPNAILEDLNFDVLNLFWSCVFPVDSKGLL